MTQEGLSENEVSERDTPMAPGKDSARPSVHRQQALEGRDGPPPALRAPAVGQGQGLCLHLFTVPL